MDPVSAIGLASSIITFVDFGTELITGAIEIYRAPDGSSAADARLQDVLNDLGDLAEELEKTFHASTRAERNIKNLAQECGEDAQELRDILRGLKMTGRRTAWKSVKAKWMSMRAESRVEELKDRLNEYRADILLNLTLVLREEQSGIGQRLKQVKDSCEELKVDSAVSLDDLKTRLLDAIGDKTETEQSLDEIKILLTQLQSDTQRIPIEHRILRQLIFSEMNSRRTQIHSADSVTCGWIFGHPSIEEPESGRDLSHSFDKRLRLKENPAEREKASNDFRAWLQRGQNIFHISGNAGCGKSTLVKYIARHDETKELLSSWAGDKTLILADFYFWASGSRWQTTIPGLQRSLIFEVLRSCRELMPKAFPLQWVRYQSRAGDLLVESMDFVDEDIQHAFDILLMHGAHANYRFCFFIDGLDEYKGDLVERRHLAQRLKEWAYGGDIKICASSRPDREYLELLEYPSARINLHQVNAPAIQSYCHRRFTESLPTNPVDNLDWKYLEHEVVDMSRGVFLWAYLVVDILITAAHQGDPHHVIRNKLHETPRELDDLYDKMLASTSWGKIDRDRSNKILLLAAENPFSDHPKTFFPHERPEIPFSKPLRLVVFTWLDDLEDSGFPYTKMYYEEANEDLRTRLDRAAKQIHALGRGLLKVRKSTEAHIEGPEVDFFHRSARDYLLQPERRALMLKSLPNFQHCHPYGKILLARWVYMYQPLIKATAERQRSSLDELTKETNINGDQTTGITTFQQTPKIDSVVPDIPLIWAPSQGVDDDLSSIWAGLPTQEEHAREKMLPFFLDDPDGILEKALALSAPPESVVRLLGQFDSVIRHYEEQSIAIMGKFHCSIHSHLRKMGDSSGSFIHWTIWQNAVSPKPSLKDYIIQEMTARPHLQETIDGSLNLLVTLVWALYHNPESVDVDFVMRTFRDIPRLDGIVFVGKGSSPALGIYGPPAHDTVMSHDEPDFAEGENNDEQVDNDAGQNHTAFLDTHIFQVWILVLAASVSTLLVNIILHERPGDGMQGHIGIARHLARMAMNQGADPHMEFHFQVRPRNEDDNTPLSINLNIFEAILLSEEKFGNPHPGSLGTSQIDMTARPLALTLAKHMDINDVRWDKRVDEGKVSGCTIDLLSGTSKSCTIELSDMLIRIY